MSIYSLENLLKNPKFLEVSNKIYNVPTNQAAKRLASLYEIHSKKFNSDKDTSIFSSPGRIEVAGNHTDHNNGKVICAAVSVDLLAVVNPINGKIIVDSVGYPLVEVDINDLDVKEDEYGTSEALVRGVLKGFIDRGFKVGGFYATTTSDIFKGAGMSSSAAFEVLICEILNVYYNESKIKDVDKAIISQYAENVYFGKPSGLMDQSAIAFGGISYIDFKDSKNPLVTKMNWEFDNLDVCVINCGGDHSDLIDDYAFIRSEMEQVADFFNKEKLRFVDEDEFYKNIPQMLEKKFAGRALLRAIHYFEENKRVEKIMDAIKTNDEEMFLSLITSSGLSSYMKLQNVHSPNDRSQPIPLALGLSEKFGASAYRVHGGGFAGTILVFITLDKEKEFTKKMSQVFGLENIYSLKIRNFGACKLDI